MNDSDKNIKHKVRGNIAECIAFAIEISGLLAIWNNNSFKEEDADFDSIVKKLYYERRKMLRQ